MKSIIISGFLVLCTTTLFAQNSNEISIIPKPAEVIKHPGIYHLPQSIKIETYGEGDFKSVLKAVKDHLRITGKMVSLVKNDPNSNFKLFLNSKLDTSLGMEGYKLTIGIHGIQIRANKPAGLFYGLQSLIQLLPKEIENDHPIKMDWKVPYLEIMDKPRFAWRGLMFDVSRHFFTKDEVRMYIHQMARYKFNLLHLHLTDDEGWRIEIKAFPLLTQKGAYRVKKEGYFGTFSTPSPDEPRNYGGYYTQDDIRDIVAFGQENFVNILPEIDVPGHSLAAIASYPELSCTPGADKYQVRSGEAIMDWGANGFTALVDNTLCPANEKVYDFLDKVLGEIAPLFPFGYIHMGGDECAKNFWEKSDAIKALMAKEGLKDQSEVQAYFEKRLEKIVESKGKKFLGWDEILEGGLAPDAIVMSWRGMKGGIQAAKMKHEVVMSPTTFAYLDYMQGDRSIEPHIYSTLRLNKAYSFEPVPDSVDSKYIIGGQANLWTEQVYNIRHAEYMTWPRAFAISETLWTPKKEKNWEDFTSRVEKHFSRLDIAEIKYSPSIYDPFIIPSLGTDKQLTIELGTEIKGLDLFYSFDNDFPDRYYPKYTGPIIAPKDAVMLKVISYRGDKPIGRMMSISIDDLMKRVAKP